jgi:two-component system, NtrC family, sensor kinase
VKFLSVPARRAGVQLLLEEDLHDIPELVGSPIDFEQVFFIMIENAIQAAEGKKDCEVQIGGRIEGNQVVIRFSDNCGGIEPENIDKIFDPFFTTKMPDKGTGLGLAVVKRIAENYGGSIGVESRWGYGTIFQIRLPLMMLR